MTHSIFDDSLTISDFITNEEINSLYTTLEEYPKIEKILIFNAKISVDSFNKFLKFLIVKPSILNLTIYNTEIEGNFENNLTEFKEFITNCTLHTMGLQFNSNVNSKMIKNLIAESLSQNFHLKMMEYRGENFFDIIDNNKSEVNYFLKNYLNLSRSRSIGDIKYLKHFQSLTLEGKKNLSKKLSELSSDNSYNYDGNKVDNYFQLNFLYYAGICKSKLISDIDLKDVSLISYPLDINCYIFSFIKLLDIVHNPNHLAQISTSSNKVIINEFVEEANNLMLTDVTNNKTFDVIGEDSYFAE